MTILAQGSVTDRPWGMTLGALGMRGLSGQVAIVSDGKQYIVAFDQGVIVAAYSPLASDAAVRLALTSNLITSTQVSDITRRMAAAPQRDEIDLLAELVRLTPDQAARLRRRLVAQRAARTFTPGYGDFVVEDRVQIPIIPGGELDVRTVIYLGAKTNLSEDRLTTELAQLGTYFELKREAVDDLQQFGFTSAEKPVLDMLLEGAYVDEIIAAQPALGERVVRAIAYSLASCGACKLAAPPRAARAVTPSTAPTLQQSRTTTQPRNAPPGQPATPRTSTGNAMPTMSRTATGVPTPIAQQGSGAVPHPAASYGSGAVPRPVAAAPSGAVPRPISSAPSGATPSRPRTPSTPPPGTENFARSRTPSVPPPMSHASVPVPSRGRPPSSPPPPSSALDAPTSPGRRSPPPRRSRRDSSAVTEIEHLLETKIPLLDRGVDHFTLLGLSLEASPADIRSAYFTLARKLHPDRLSAIGVEDEERRAQRLMAQVNLAFAVLNDPVKRNEYTSIVHRGGEAAVKAEEARADELAMRVMRAEEAFKQGEMALRRDQLQQAIEQFQMAVELQPREAEYQALLAWAQFAIAPDKTKIANETRKALLRAADANDRSPSAKFYLGRVERMLGREREALQYFQEVLAIKPSHVEAASEARILQQRLNKR
ncbi:MAG TPA: DnaJ domain-containing protein [Kofleriaceae bacterium]|nr:DnaJ domain-containing protein [Kofleriaceae bacterium]